MITFDLRIVAKIFIFQLVSFDYSLVTFNCLISHLHLTIGNSQSLVAEILIFQCQF